MNPTDPNPAEAFFADLLLPLKQARQRRGLSYLALRPEPAAASYWEAPVTRHGGVTTVALADADGAALVSALAEHWLAQGDAQLASLQPELEALRQALQEAAAGTPERPASPSYSAYPLF